MGTGYTWLPPETRYEKSGFLCLTTSDITGLLGTPSPFLDTTYPLVSSGVPGQKTISVSCKSYGTRTFLWTFRTTRSSCLLLQIRWGDVWSNRGDRTDSTFSHHHLQLCRLYNAVKKRWVHRVRPVPPSGTDSLVSHLGTTSLLQWRRETLKSHVIFVGLSYNFTSKGPILRPLRLSHL